MKNLLKLLSILAISTPIPLTVVACDTPDSKKDTKIDISTKIPNNINLGTLKFKKNIKSEFLNKLQAKLVAMSGLKTITSDDYDVYIKIFEKYFYFKDLYFIDIFKPNDFLTLNLNIKIVAKNGAKFKGEKNNITISYCLLQWWNDLNEITNIDSPSQIEAIYPNAVTKEEIENALDSIINNSVQKICYGDIVIKNLDYVYDIIDEDCINRITTIDLSTTSKIVKVKITAQWNSIDFVGMTNLISVTLPKAIKIIN
ncbi:MULTISPECIES: hypothetical protein [unclassified Spiroplasma]|uniref:hypothetical protein n=1 Tax=unclassified Spiroplasma TaxID=2637901 RepID=UPI0030D102EF